MSEASPDPRPTEFQTPAETNGDGAEHAGYTVHLDQFEGPLDLLLYLIQRDEIDIYDIPIAHITQQYLASIEQLDMFDLDNAGEFLVMASTLMRIKARMLLPVQRLGEEDDEEGDPRDELVRRLLEYKRYKEAAQSLEEKYDERSNYFGRGQDYGFLDQAGEEEPPELSLSLFDLLRAVNNVLEQMRSESVHHVYTEVYTVEGQEDLILQRVEVREKLRFAELFEHMRVKMEVVVTFIALLDLLKSRRLRAYQSEAYGEIWIEPGAGEIEPDDDTLDPTAVEDEVVAVEAMETAVEPLEGEDVFDEDLDDDLEALLGTDDIHGADEETPSQSENGSDVTEDDDHAS